MPQEEPLWTFFVVFVMTLGQYVSFIGAVLREGATYKVFRMFFDAKGVSILNSKDPFCVECRYSFVVFYIVASL